MENFGGNSYLRTQGFEKLGFGFGAFEPFEMKASHQVLQFLKPSGGL